MMVWGSPLPRLVDAVPSFVGPVPGFQTGGQGVGITSTSK